MKKEIARKKRSFPSFAAEKIPEVPAEATALFQDFEKKTLDQKVQEFKKFKEEQSAYLEDLKRGDSKKVIAEKMGNPSQKQSHFLTT